MRASARQPARAIAEAAPRAAAGLLAACRCIRLSRTPSELVVRATHVEAPSRDWIDEAPEPHELAAAQELLGLLPGELTDPNEAVEESGAVPHRPVRLGGSTSLRAPVTAQSATQPTRRIPRRSRSRVSHMPTRLS